MTLIAAAEVAAAPSGHWLASASGVQIIDVSDPINPRLRARFNTPGSANRLVVAE
jgi:hypothetical protein